MNICTFCSNIGSSISNRRTASTDLTGTSPALGSPTDAEDAAQDAFLLAYRRLDSFRGDASFKTWLLTITWHQAINRRRSVTGDEKPPCASLPNLAL